MANYRPIAKTITAGSAVSAGLLNVKLSTTSWGILIARGSAIFSNTVLRSGGVAVWESTKATTAAPDHETFSDANGVYGVTCRAGVQLRFKFYSQ